MQIRHRMNQTICVLELDGNLTSAEVSQLRNYTTDIMKDPTLQNILINMKEVGFLDSSGLGTFISLWRILHQRKGVLGLSNLNQRLDRLIHMTSLTDLIKIYNTEQEALNDQTFTIPLLEE